MLRHTLINISIFMLIFSSLVFSQSKEFLINELKNEYQKFDNLRHSSRYLAKSINLDIYDIKNHIIKVKKKLKSFSNDLDNPIYFDNDIDLDQNMDLLDFYVYEYSENSCQVFAWLKNKQRKYLEWVKLRYNLYSNGAFIGTDYTYIDFESYGYSGISPYKYSFINTYIDKADFDSIAYQVEYDIESGEDNILWDQILHLQSVVIQPSGSYNKWQGVINNNYNYSVKYPNIYACIFKDNRMISLDYTYVDVQNDSLPPISTGVFDSYIDLPSNYDEIKYYLNYSLYSLDGEGNLPPNIPIFSHTNYKGFTRSNTIFDIFVIDANGDRCDLLVDYGDDSVMNWEGSFTSGYNTRVQHPFEFDGQYYIKAKTRDGDNLETNWSGSINTIISPSTVPLIIHSDLDSAHYKKSYFACIYYIKKGPYFT
jgi:hypothetical protein